MNVPKYEIHNKDCITQMHEWKKEGRQFDMAIFSPPFLNLYVYSGDPRDLSNCKSLDEFLLHYQFFADALTPLIKDGRMVVIHIQNLAQTLTSHGEISLLDIRSRILKCHEKAGLLFWGETGIFRNPKPLASVKKTQQLMHGVMCKDATKTRPALMDYALILKKKGENLVPVINDSDISFSEWCHVAGGVWWDIDETHVLGKKLGKGISGNKKATQKSQKDEKHMTPTQIPFYSRFVRWYSNKGESILDPFGGGGTNNDTCISLERYPVSIELKESYCFTNEANSRIAIDELAVKQQPTLFSCLD